MPTMVRINGSPSKNSRTGVLVNAVGNTIATKLPFESHTIALSDAGKEVMCGLTRTEISARGEQLVQLVERADLLVVGTPVYRASYTGILKHFFDIVDREIMRGRKAVLCATGNSLMHALMLEHQLRPLMGFFSIHTLPTTLYGLPEDFDNERVSSPALNERINWVADEVRALFPAVAASARDAIS